MSQTKVKVTVEVEYEANMDYYTANSVDELVEEIHTELTENVDALFIILENSEYTVKVEK